MANAIQSVRPYSTFASYVVKTPEQEQAKAAFMQLSEALVQGAPQFQSGQNPIPNAAIYSMAGGPGIGKTHLMEAVINDVHQRAPDLFNSLFLMRENFTHATMTAIFDHTFGRKPIILIDDLYSDTQSVEKISPGGVIGMMNFISYAYENRCLVLTTCNFPFLSGVLEKVKQEDKVGRVYSRCQEMFSRGGEFEIKGPDHRQTLAAQAGKSGGLPVFKL